VGDRDPDQGSRPGSGARPTGRHRASGETSGHPVGPRTGAGQRSLRGRPLPSLPLSKGTERSVGRPLGWVRRQAVRGRVVPARGAARSLTLPLMILPQVHLRKPCYDFYFL
jgi:hypothetical protein